MEMERERACHPWPELTYIACASPFEREGLTTQQPKQLMTKLELAQENTDLKAEINEAYLALLELKSYLLSPKFHLDTTVQTADVLHRLAEVQLTPNP